MARNQTMELGAMVTMMLDDLDTELLNWGFGLLPS